MPLLLCIACVGLASGRDLQAQTPGFSVVGTIPGRAEFIALQGAYAYLAAGNTIGIVDLTTPASPRRMGSFTFPMKIYGFVVSGRFVYVAHDSAGLAVLDVSDPAAPVLRGALKTPGQAQGVAVSGTKAVIADLMTGFDLIDVADRSKPVLVGSYFTEGIARHVATAGSLAYVVDTPSGLTVFDVSKAGEPNPISEQQSADAPRSIAVSSATIGGQERTIACLLGQSGVLQIYDVSNPAALQKVGNYDTPGRALSVKLRGTTAYVADGPAGLQVVDLSDPAKPAITASYKTATPARDVAVGDALVIVSLENDVVILRQHP